MKAVYLSGSSLRWGVWSALQNASMRLNCGSDAQAPTHSLQYDHNVQGIREVDSNWAYSVYSFLDPFSFTAHRQSAVLSYI